SVASLLSIGACVVDDPGQGIEILVRPVPGRGWSDEAQVVHGLSRDRLAAEGLEPADAMRRLAEWLEAVVPAGSVPVFVSFNAPFDWLFVADHLWRHLGRNPFGTSAVDLKALFMGRHLDSVRSWAETRSVDVRRIYPVALPHTHGALDDAREQAEVCRLIRGGRA
ncbi:MAG: 3'-5' exonuclease, partial [Chloroflexi bacterium]|nr:3'-5' exonuclease [Chloroflexota bacterium]